MKILYFRQLNKLKLSFQSYQKPIFRFKRNNFQSFSWRRKRNRTRQAKVKKWFQTKIICQLDVLKNVPTSQQKFLYKSFLRQKKTFFPIKFRRGVQIKGRFFQSIYFKMKIKISSRLIFRIFCPSSTFQKTSDSSIIFKI